uniref:Uncharacterized protein n=1 Tax=Favella ehrenbergii TaxID=182087 RepID=A0A7S3I7B9_9SPIT|mmetsp:Transcript_4507/g.5588  ORF Transcript_4507/g.5588 Transcript_4507/m.5588 type:complete len:109 (+) Transcript_4507:296-622(+)
MNDGFNNTFLSSPAGVPKLESLEDMERAMGVLFKYRAGKGLESELMFRVRSLEPEEYALCSAETQKQGDKYRETYMMCVGDTRPHNYPQMLENLDTWLDKTYGPCKTD